MGLPARAWANAGSAVTVFSDDGEQGARLQHREASVEVAQADLGTLEVDEDAHRPPGRIRRFPHSAVDDRMLFPRPMGQVEAGHVHTGLDQGDDSLR